jgi:hypothetical protein
VPLKFNNLNMKKKYMIRHIISAAVQGVKRRGLALNINPLALLPGSKPLKTPTSAVKSPSTPSTPTISDSPVLMSPKEEPVISEPLPLPPTAVPELKSPDAASFDDMPAKISQLSHLGKVYFKYFFKFCIDL